MRVSKQHSIDFDGNDKMKKGSSYIPLSLHTFTSYSCQKDEEPPPSSQRYIFTTAIKKWMKGICMPYRSKLDDEYDIKSAQPSE